MVLNRFKLFLVPNTVFYNPFVFTLDCSGEQNGTAFVDDCGNCVGGNTGQNPCIPFSPSVSLSLASNEVGAITDLSFTISQDANEPDMVSALVMTDGGTFNLSTLSVNDVVGFGTGIAGGGYLTSDFTLFVDFILSANHVALRAVDNATSNVIGTFELENLTTGAKILSVAPADNNNITTGNTQTVTLTNLFTNPSNVTTLNIYSTINSELSDIDNQVFPIAIDVADCNGDVGGSAYVDNCNNCVGGNTGLSECITFSPTTVVTLADSACSSTTDLEITVSQDPNEPDMSTSFFSSNNGAFNFNSISLGQTLGFASLTAAGGDISFNADLIVVSILNNQIIVSAINQLDGTVMGSFTVSNNNPGIAIIANPSYNDGNNVTLGNTSQVIFYDLFETPGINESLTFYSQINSEIGTTSNEVIDFGVFCPCTNSSSTTDVTACDSYDWNGTTYTASGSYTFTTTNASGCDSTATLNLTINNATSSTTDVTACDSYDWNGITYTASGSYTFTTTNASGCDSTATLNLTINNATSSTTDVTACDSYDWNGTTYTASGSYTFTTTNASGCDSTATLNLTINNATSSTTDVTACDSYDWNGTTYTASGSYTFYND